MKKTTTILLLIGLYGFCHNYSMAQWVQTGGPEGGYIHSITDDDTYVYAATFGAVYRLEKGETSWISLPEINGAHSLAVSGSTIVAGLDGGGVYRSTDHGMSWSVWVSGLHNQSAVYALAVNGGDLFAGTDRGVYLSTDHGANWTPRNSGMDNLLVLCMLIKGSNIFAGTMGGGIYRSENYGISWSPVNSGLKNESVWVNSLAAISDTLFAGTWWADGVYRSIDNGDNWIITNTGLGNPDVNTLAVVDTMLIAGTFGGIYHTEDKGDNWGPLDDSPGYVVSSFHLTGPVIFAGTNNGIYISPDKGESWEDPYDGFIGTIINSVHSTGTNLFAGTANSGLYRSDDEGTTWEKLNLYSSNITSFIENGTDFFSGTSYGVYKSEDEGDTWVPSNNGMEFEQISSLNVISDGKASNYLFAGTDSSGVFLSTDNGDIWNRINTGLTDTLVHCLAVSGTNLYAGTESGVFVTTNKGVSWIPAGTDLNGIHVNCMIVRNGNIFAGTTNGVYISTNNGTSWTPVNTGMTDLNILCLAANDTYLLAGTFFDKVFVSEDNGDTWTPVNSGLRDLPVLSLGLTETYIFAGSRGAGVWQYPLSGIITAVQPPANETHLGFTLGQNFPNPFSTSTNIRFTVPTRAKVILKILDQSGREVEVLVNSELMPGTYEKTFNRDQLPGGIYYYQLQCGEFSQTKKLLVL